MDHGNDVLDGHQMGAAITAIEGIANVIVLTGAIRGKTRAPPVSIKNVKMYGDFQFRSDGILARRLSGSVMTVVEYHCVMDHLHLQFFA